MRSSQPVVVEFINCGFSCQPFSLHRRVIAIPAIWFRADELLKDGDADAGGSTLPHLPRRGRRTAAPTLDLYWERRGAPHQAPSGAPLRSHTHTSPLRLPLIVLLRREREIFNGARSPACTSGAPPIVERFPKHGDAAGGIRGEAGVGWWRFGGGGANRLAPYGVRPASSNTTQPSAKPSFSFFRVGAGGVLPFCVGEFVFPLVSTDAEFREDKINQERDYALAISS